MTLQWLKIKARKMNVAFEQFCVMVKSVSARKMNVAFEQLCLQILLNHREANVAQLATEATTTTGSDSNPATTLTQHVAQQIKSPNIYVYKMPLTCILLIAK